MTFWLGGVPLAKGFPLKGEEGELEGGVRGGGWGRRGCWWWGGGGTGPPGGGGGGGGRPKARHLEQEKKRI